MSEYRKKKVILAAGGTGGHLFPAQKLAKDLQLQTDILFVGSGLKTNPFFYRDQFSFKEIKSRTPFKRKKVFACLAIIAGIIQSLKVLKDFKPDLVVGFGSFHSFPLLAAAKLKKIPYVLFESNCFPGKVNRLFSKWARVSAIQFDEASKNLRGKAVEVSMPLWNEKKVDKTLARAYFGLDPSLFTLLIFGGSQGAGNINDLIYSSLKNTPEKYTFQVIHITGSKEQSEKMKTLYASLKLKAFVKEFEEEMSLAWQSADLAICRSGAATLAEQIAYEVPAILIPYLLASDQHQKKNATFMMHRVRGAVDLSEEGLTSSHLIRTINSLIENNQERLKAMRDAIKQFKLRQERKDLLSEILAQLKL